MPITEPLCNRKAWRMKTTVALFTLLFCSLPRLFAQQDSLQNATWPLPLRVISFKVGIVSKSVQLQWSVSSNEDAKAFEIERAEESGAYKKVGSKLAASRTGNEAYEFVDALPKMKTTFRYRVKIISKDGADVFSDVENTRIEDEALQCKLKQNPVRQQIQVEVISSERSNLQTSVYTAYGQKIKTEATKLFAGTNLISISSQNLLPGLHRLVLESGSERKVISFVKE